MVSISYSFCANSAFEHPSSAGEFHSGESSSPKEETRSLFPRLPDSFGIFMGTKIYLQTDGQLEASDTQKVGSQRIHAVRDPRAVGAEFLVVSGVGSPCCKAQGSLWGLSAAVGLQSHLGLFLVVSPLLGFPSDKNRAAQRNS